MTKQITRQQLSAALVERHGQERQQHLYTASVGIAGLGGLGSNIAVQLTRLGIGHLTLVTAIGSRSVISTGKATDSVTSADLNPKP